MCTKMADTIVLFNVSGTPIKISTEKLAVHPQSLLAEMVNTTVQPADGFFIECCPMIFGYMLRFVLNGMPINPVFVANTIGVSEDHIRKVVDEFKFKDIYLEDVKEEVKESKVKLPDQDIWKATLGGLEELKVWLESGIDPNIKCKTWGSTPLMYAAQNGRLACVQELFKYKVDVNAKSNNGKTALHFAVDNNHLDITKLLLTMKADPNLKDNKGYTCLHYASQNPTMVNIITELLKNGVGINIQTNFGNTPLNIAICNDNLTGIKELLKHQADVNIKDIEGSTPLHIASAIGSLEIVKLLIKSGADTKLHNNKGDIPLVTASKCGHHTIVKELAAVYVQ